MNTFSSDPSPAVKGLVRFTGPLIISENTVPDRVFVLSGTTGSSGYLLTVHELMKAMAQTRIISCNSHNTLQYKRRAEFTGSSPDPLVAPR